MMNLHHDLAYLFPFLCPVRNIFQVLVFAQQSLCVRIAQTMNQMTQSEWNILQYLSGFTVSPSFKRSLQKSWFKF